MQAVILAGGERTRLQPITTNVPKPLVPIFDRPLLEHTINLLAKHGIKEVIIAASHIAADIADYFGDGERWGIDIRYSIEHLPMGTAGALKLVQPLIKGTFFALNGDLVTDFDLSSALAMHKQKSALASILIHHADEPTQFGVADVAPDGRLVRFLEKPKTPEVFTDTISTGIYIFEPEALSAIPYDQPCNLETETFRRFLNNWEPVFGLSIPGYWGDIGNLAHFRSVHFDALTGKLSLDIPASQVDAGIWLGERVEIHPNAEISAPVYIGDGAIIRSGAIIGHGSVIGADTLVDEGAQVYGSVVGTRTMVGRNVKMKRSIVGGGNAIPEELSVEDSVMLSQAEYAEPKTEQSHVRTPEKPGRRIHMDQRV